MSEFAKDSLTLEETNQLRAKLGLKPILDDGPSKKDKDDEKPSSALDGQEERANENYDKRKQKERAEREEREARERIAKAQNKRELAKKLCGPTLGDAEPSSLGSSSSSSSSSKDTLKWLKSRQKKEKAHAAARLAELEAQEAEIAASYDSKDLAGLRVGHDLDSFDFQDGEERVLTLRDSKILGAGEDEDDDELMDSTLHQSELDKQNLERKKGVKAYTGLDDEEFDPNGNGVGNKKGVLSKYDADIKENDRARARREREDGGFTLGAPVRNKEEEVKKKQEETARMLNRTLLSLDYTKNQEASDYLAEGDFGFKKSKSKKKKKKASRVKLEADDDDETAAAPSNAEADSEMKDASTGEVVSAPSRRRVQETENFVDDDELAASLARARRQKAKKTFAKMTPEMIAANLKAQQEAEAAEAAEKEREASQANIEPAPAVKREGSSELLTFDATSEFVRNISNRPVEEPRRRIKRGSESATPGPSSTTLDEIKVKEEPEEETSGAVDVEMLTRPPIDEEDEGEDYEEGPPDLESKEPPTQEEEEVETSNATGSLAGTLALLRNQGLISSINSEQQAREKEQLKYDAWLAARRSEDAAREAERLASKAQGSAKDQATREWENKQREAEDARRAIDKFKDYKPDIDIKYHDSHGRVLNNREAWKHLSHEFHGKGHGHKQQEKIRKRIELEKKQEKMFAGDSKGMGSTFTERAERMGQAHMVLSVGARGNAPQDIGMLGPNTVKKGSSSNSNKAKTSNGDASSSRNLLPNGSPPPPGGLDSWLGGIQSGIATTSTVATTGKRAGFAPVRSSPIANGSGTPNGDAKNGGDGEAEGSQGGSRFKLTFGTKRENPDDSSDQAQKRRA